MNYSSWGNIIFSNENLLILNYVSDKHKFICTIDLLSNFIILSKNDNKILSIKEFFIIISLELLIIIIYINISMLIK